MYVVASATVRCTAGNPFTSGPPTLILTEGVTNVVRGSTGQYRVYLDGNLPWHIAECMVVVCPLDINGTSTGELSVVTAQLYEEGYFYDEGGNLYDPMDPPYILVNTKKRTTPSATPADATVMSDTVDFSITVFAQGGSGSLSDSVAPTMTNLSHPQGATISQNTTISFRISDNVGLNFVPIFVEFPDGDYEVIYDGTKFAKRYRQSTITPVTGGFDFSIRRSNGWPGAPRITTLPVDTAGNVGGN